MLTHLYEWRESGEYFDFEGRRIFYRLSSENDEVLLCLHGFPTSSLDYRKIWNELAARYSLFTFDMLGYGFSDKPRKGIYTTHNQVDVLQALLEEKGISRVHILSHDYGNTIVQELLARSAEGSVDFRIETICFMNGALFPETHRPILAQKLLIGPIGAVFGQFTPDSFFKRSLSSIFGAATKPTAEELDDFVAAFKFNQGKRIAHKLIQYMLERYVYRERWVEPLRALQQPFRFINGLADPVSGQHLVERFREVVPNQTDIIELKEIGHFPHFEVPETVLEKYFEFRENAVENL